MYCSRKIKNCTCWRRCERLLATFEPADKTALFTSTSCQKPHVLHELHVARDECRACLRATGRPPAVGRQQGPDDTCPTARATFVPRSPPGTLLPAQHLTERAFDTPSVCLFSWFLLVPANLFGENRRVLASRRFKIWVIFRGQNFV